MKRAVLLILLGLALGAAATLTVTHKTVVADCTTSNC